MALSRFDIHLPRLARRGLYAEHAAIRVGHRVRFHHGTGYVTGTVVGRDSRHPGAWLVSIRGERDPVSCRAGMLGYVGNAAVTGGAA